MRRIEIGKHGLYIRKDSTRASPSQVAAEYGWDRITFLEETCRKAGLPQRLEGKEYGNLHFLRRYFLTELGSRETQIFWMKKLEFT